jgi:hypothetical protein
MTSNRTMSKTQTGATADASRPADRLPLAEPDQSAQRRW